MTVMEGGERNLFAILGFVMTLLFLQPLGLIFAILGVIRAKHVNGLGRKMSIAAIIISGVQLLIIPVIVGGILLILLLAGFFAEGVVGYMY